MYINQLRIKKYASGQVMINPKIILVTGGAGFIGSNFVNKWLASTDSTVINLDKLTYAGNLENLATHKDNPAHIFVRGDMGDQELTRQLKSRH